jgi:hypothetical protein
VDSYEKDAADALERLTAKVKDLHASIRSEAFPERPSEERSPRLPVDDDERLRPLEPEPEPER